MRFTYSDRHRGFVTGALAVLVMALGVVHPPVARAADETRLTDPNKKFHRLFISGNGDPGPDAQDAQIARDAKAISDALTGLGTSAPGSSAKHMPMPDNSMVLNWIAGIKNVVAAGDEVTIYFKGHGNDDFVRLNGSTLASANLSANQLANALNQLPAGVTVIVILDSCFGGSFADNIGESDTKKVIGPKTKCWFDPRSALWAWWHDTFSEDIVEYLTAVSPPISGQELKDYLTSPLQGWDLGVPSATETKPKKGKSLCPCTKPKLSGASSGTSGTLVSFSGTNFASSGTVSLALYNNSGGATALGTASLSAGSFSTSVTVPSISPGSYLLVANDGTYEDWIDDFVVSPETNGGGVPTASTIALVALLAAFTAGGMVVIGRRQEETAP